MPLNKQTNQPNLVIKPATTDCRAEPLQMNHEFISIKSDAKSTSHGNCVANSIHKPNQSPQFHHNRFLKPTKVDFTLVFLRINF